MFNQPSVRPSGAQFQKTVLQVVKPFKPSPKANISQVFRPETTRNMLTELSKMICEEITGHMVCTTKTDASGVTLVVSCDKFTFSMIYSDMEGDQAK